MILREQAAGNMIQIHLYAIRNQAASGIQDREVAGARETGRLQRCVWGRTRLHAMQQMHLDATGRPIRGAAAMGQVLTGALIMGDGVIILTSSQRIAGSTLLLHHATLQTAAAGKPTSGASLCVR